MDYKKESTIKNATENTSNSYYWGMDSGTYPGDDKLRDWWSNGPFWYISLYLGPTTQHSDTSYMNKFSTMTGIGWGLLPLYVGKQAGDDKKSPLSFEMGRSDAGNTNTLGHNAGLPTSRYVYLDIEQGGLLSSTFISYIQGWVDAMYNNYDFWPGIYCSYKDTADQVKNTLGPGYPNVRYWVYHIGSWTSQGTGTGSAPNPADSGVSYASTWQGIQNINKTYGSSTIYMDGNTSIYKDPSQ